MIGRLFEQKVLDAWAETSPIVTLLFLAIVIDVAAGIVLALIARVANSTAARTGIARKIMELLCVAACSLLDGVLPRISVPLIGEMTWGAAVAFGMLIWEVISVTEKAGMLGLPIGSLKDRLLKVRDGLGGSLATPEKPPAKDLTE